MERLGGVPRLHLPGGDGRRHGGARAVPVVVAEVKGVPARARARSTTSGGRRGTTCCEPAEPARALSPWSVEQIRAWPRSRVLAGDWLDHGRLRPAMLDREIADRRSTRSSPTGDPERHPAPASPEPSTTSSPSSSPEGGGARRLDPGARRGHRRDPGLVARRRQAAAPGLRALGPPSHGRGPDDAVVHPAAAVELLHTFALLHDDVMDARPDVGASQRPRHPRRDPPAPSAGRRRLVRRQRRDPRRRPGLRVGRRAARPGRRPGAVGGPVCVHHAAPGGDRRPVPRPRPGRRPVPSRRARSVALFKSAATR